MSIVAFKDKDGKTRRMISFSTMGWHNFCGGYVMFSFYASATSGYDLPPPEANDAPTPLEGVRRAMELGVIGRTEGTVIAADLEEGAFGRWLRGVKRIPPWLSKDKHYVYEATLKRFINSNHNSRCISLQVVKRRAVKKPKQLTPIFPAKANF